MTTLWIASNNEKKRVELARLLGGLSYQLKLQSEAPESLDVEENAPDFAGNAELKAVALARLVGAPALGDDSGLCVDALDGRPGVHSARYAGPDATDQDRIQKLLGELAGVPGERRTAHFVCHLCLADAQGNVLERIEGTCSGVIMTEPSGDGGFGYDPVFRPTEAGDHDPSATFAQLTPEQKDAISHRGVALRSLLEYFERHPL